MKHGFKSLIVLLVLLIAPGPIFASSKLSKTVLEKPSPLAVLPISIKANRIHVIVDQSGLELEMLLDTGATGTVFLESEKLPATRFNLGEQVGVSFPALNQTAMSSRISGLSLKLGLLTLPTQNGLYIRKDQKITKKLGSNFDGILGRDFFLSYTLEFDPQLRELRLYKRLTDLRPYYAISHQIRMNDGLPHIRYISKLPWERHASQKELLLDTGYPGHVVIWNGRKFRRSMGVHMPLLKTGMLTLGTVDFGDLKFVNTPIFVSGRTPEHLSKREGIIGASLLNQFRHVIDFSNRYVLVAPLYDKQGNPLQFVDGRIYTPANERYFFRLFDSSTDSKSDFSFHVQD